MSSLEECGPLVVVGGGPAGSLLACLLAQRGHSVHLFESRGDLRRNDVDSGRSINLALATRGIEAMAAAGIGEEVAKITIPMVGRMVHNDGEVALQPYGTLDHEVIHSVNRSDLNAILLNAAEATGRVTLSFGQRLRTVDLESSELRFTTGPNAPESVVPFGLVFGADGTNSPTRAAMLEVNGGSFGEEPLDHGYKELTIPPGEDGQFRLDPNALHIWPRGDFMLIALANPAGDFTATLFMPNEAVTPEEPGVATEGGSFAELDSPAAVRSFFQREFESFVALVPDLVEQFFDNPTGELGTTRCVNWSYRDRMVIVGDAAHGIVPFHGQGMNAALESALRMVDHLDAAPDDVAGALLRYSQTRKPDTDAIADMALTNYWEMRAGVTDPLYLAKRNLALEMQRRFPERFLPRYGMVMFTTLPYAAVVERHRMQDELLGRLLGEAGPDGNVDPERAAELISMLAPIPVDAMPKARLH